MSITTSRDERAQAIARIEQLSIEELQRDLVHWTLASHESAAQYHELVERQAAVRDMNREEETWIYLLADELHKRRRAARSIS